MENHSLLVKNGEGNKSAKYTCRKNTKINHAKLFANKKLQDHVADTKDKHILQNIEEVFTKKFNEQQEILELPLASNQKLINKRIDKLSKTVQELKKSLENSESVNPGKILKVEKLISIIKAENVNTNGYLEEIYEKLRYLEDCSRSKNQIPESNENNESQREYLPKIIVVLEKKIGMQIILIESVHRIIRSKKSSIETKQGQSF